MEQNKKRSAGSLALGFVLGVVIGAWVWSLYVRPPSPKRIHDYSSPPCGDKEVWISAAATPPAPNQASPDIFVVCPGNKVTWKIATDEASKMIAGFEVHFYQRQTPSSTGYIGTPFQSSGKDAFDYPPQGAATSVPSDPAKGLPSGTPYQYFKYEVIIHYKPAYPGPNPQTIDPGGVITDDK